MNYQITKEQLHKWCSISSKKLQNHPESKVNLIVRNGQDGMRMVGNMMADEVIANNKKGKATKWVLPCGPNDQYEYFAERINSERISLKNLYIFQMDEYLDWESRPFPKNSYYNLESRMHNYLYSKIDPELNVLKEHVFVPTLRDLDLLERKAEELGGIDTVWAGVGCKGLVAFNETPQSPYYRVSLEQYLNSKTRVVDLNDDTIVAHSERYYGGFYDCVPTKAVTVGFKVMCAAKRAVLIIRESRWKKTCVRVMLFSNATTEYPVTILTNYIKDATLVCDHNALEHPLEEMKLEVI